MISADLHMLAGAYALGALDDAERGEFEQHLAECEACAVEAAEFLATGARLALAVAESPPTALKQQVLRRIAQVRQEPPKVDLPAPPAPPASSTARVRRGTMVALAACVAAAVALGGVAVQYTSAQDVRRQAQRTEAQAAQISAVLSAPDARTVVAGVGGAGQGARATVVTSPSENRAVFLTPGLPTLAAGRTYELWFDDAGVMRPAGLVAPGTGGATVLLNGPVGSAEGVGVTVEPSGGSPRPTGAPIALLAFPRA
ncbi:anti-sigma factor domain-containing protein [Streptacidiphilus sp. P02-A3a]|uniref:anti-sigma factor n=1 Tax=Streptacidiphilus sp. P02-A3a TaxID=2704468 RepID=UPI0015F91FA0|nr:anti-sigma factor [Streptacidiphilus sp. P02-A3a]QMU69383.1 anti-sigma factor [Streptacidiphilus sp. P02-A3a]